MTRTLLLPSLATLSLAAALTALSAAPASADTLTGRMAECYEEAKDSYDSCMFDGARFHGSTGWRRAWHNTRCRTAFVVNAAACLPSGVWQTISNR